MALFTGIGDFFRGAFGEDSEEKKRRKQREAQEAAARKRQQAAQPRPTNRPTQQNVVEQITKPTIQQPAKPKLQQVKEQPKPAPRPAAPRVEIPAYKNPGDRVMDFFSANSPQDKAKRKAQGKPEEHKDNLPAQVGKKVIGVGAGLVRETTVKPVVTAARTADERMQDEKDRQARDLLTKLKSMTPEERKALLANSSTFKDGKLSLDKPGQGAYFRNPLKSKEKTQVDVTDDKAIERFIKDMETGDKKNDKGRESKNALDRQIFGNEPIQDYKNRMEGLEKEWKDVPGGKTLAKLATIANVALDLPALGASKEVRTAGAETIDESAPWLKRFFGRGDNIAKGAEEEAKVVDDVIKQVEDKTPSYQKLGDKAAEVDKEATKTTREAELRAVVDDETQPAFRRKQAAQELEDSNLKLDPEDPLTKPPLELQKDIDNMALQETEKLNKMVNSNPDLTRQQVEEAVAATKAKVIKLADEMKLNRQKALGAVEDNIKQTDEAVKTQQDAVAQVAGDASARTTPPANQVVEGTPQPRSPEIDANNPYAGKTTDEVVYKDAPTFNERGELVIGQKLSPDRIIRENITRPLENLADRGVRALQRSDNRVGRGIGRLFTGGSREAGILPNVQTARMQLRGGVETGKLSRDAIADLSKGFDDEGLNRVWATLDPEFAGRAGMDIPANLTPDELDLQSKLKTVIDNTTQENLRRGLITPEQAANESYLKRAYSIYDGAEEVGNFEKGFRQELLGQYKGRKVVSDEMVEQAIKDPTYLVGKKTAESNAMWAMQDYGNFLAKNGDISDVAKPGFTKIPDSPVFGEAAGKYIPQNLAEDFTGFQYNNAMVSAWNDVITAYDRLGVRQAKKQLLTIFNPAVRLGNQVTNRGIFSQLNGVNPVQFNYWYDKVGKEIGKDSQLYREAVSQGLTGVDISQAEFFANRVAKSSGDDNVGKKALDWVRTSYSDADDKARIAAFAVHRNRGYSVEEAARMVQRGFQDYKSVGFFYDMAAKTPIIGNAFVRFAADSVRIAKNAAVDHPLRTLSTVAAWSTFVNGMSVLSGESTADKKEGAEDQNIAQKAFNLATGNNKSDAQKERENRFGSPKLPFTDVSMAVQTPWGEVNVARFMPWYQLNEVSNGQIGRFLPIQASPFEQNEDGKWQVNSQGMNDPLLGQAVQLLVDRDFRGKSISDPNVSPENADQFRNDPLTSSEAWKNRFRFLFNNNAPLGREIDQTASSYATTDLPGSDKAMDLTGGKDLYGKERNLAQALARDLGFKVEEQGEEQAKDRRGMAEYQAEKAEIERELEGLTPNAQEAYKRLTGYYKLREDVPNEFSPGDTRKKKAPQYEWTEDKWKDLASHPELYQLLVDKKKRESMKVDEDGKSKPLQPEFDERLSESFRKQIIQNKMVAPGDDAELDQRMYSSPEWDYYQNLKDEYKDKSKQYYPESGDDEFVDELVKNQDEKFPTKPDLLKQYSAQYKLYTDGKRDKPEWNDALTAQKEAYNRLTLDWTNKAREKRGLPAITWDVWNNPTFGFDETPSSGFGFGFGRGGGGGGGTKDVNTLTELTNYGDSVNRLDPLEAQQMPNAVALFQKLMAGSKGSKAKPKLGASAKGQ